MGKILDASLLYSRLKEDLKKELKSCGELTLACVRVGHDYSSALYAAAQQKLAKELGVKYLNIETAKDITQEDFLDKIKSLNQKKEITGIILNKPFPAGWREEKIFGAVDPNKDIEGMNPSNLGKLMMGKYSFVSPTVLSVMEFVTNPQVMAAFGGSLYGKEAVVVGASLLIGKPLSLLLTNLHATVTLAHIGTTDAGKLQEHVERADLLVSAAGRPHLIKGSWIKKGAIAVDVGTGQKEGSLCGDIETQKAIKRAAFVTPVPGGVGKLTTLFLFKNLISAGCANK